MLLITLPEKEYFIPETSSFRYEEERELHLEHSLFTISKWEEKWRKPFLNTQKTPEETIDYVRCMCTDGDIDIQTIARMTREDWQKIESYIQDPATATTFAKDKKKGGRTKRITSEEIYYMMSDFNIPYSCEHWHLNRLMTLIQICAIRGNPQKKMSRSELLKRQAMLNAARRGKTGSKG